MDPLTIALATFGIQKLRGKSTKRSIRDAAIAAGLGQFAGMQGIGPFQSFGTTGNYIGKQAIGTVAPTGNLVQPTLTQQLGQSTVGQGITRLIGEPNLYNAQGQIVEKGSGIASFSPGAKLGLGVAATTALAGDDDDVEMPEGTRPEDYEKAKKKADEQLKDILDTYEYDTSDAMGQSGMDPYNYGNNSMFTFNKGGIAEIKKFNSGGINYLPSKVDHDEKDVNNYVRATGYVEDGSGNGDKDEDTMLAQLADGEFVSRADAILGAGIMEGADPKSYKDMRKKGAAFFYGQQAKFKRIFDLLDAAREKAN